MPTPDEDKTALQLRRHAGDTSWKAVAAELGVTQAVAKAMYKRAAIRQGTWELRGYETDAEWEARPEIAAQIAERKAAAEAARLCMDELNAERFKQRAGDEARDIARIVKLYPEGQAKFESLSKLTRGKLDNQEWVRDFIALVQWIESDGFESLFRGRILFPVAQAEIIATFADMSVSDLLRDVKDGSWQTKSYGIGTAMLTPRLVRFLARYEPSDSTKRPIDMAKAKRYTEYLQRFGFKVIEP